MLSLVDAAWVLVCIKRYAAPVLPAADPGVSIGALIHGLGVPMPRSVSLSLSSLMMCLSRRYTWN